MTETFCIQGNFFWLATSELLGPCLLCIEVVETWATSKYLAIFCYLDAFAD